MTVILIEREKFGNRYAQRDMSCEDEGKNWGDASTQKTDSKATRSQVRDMEQIRSHRRNQFC